MNDLLSILEQTHRDIQQNKLDERPENWELMKAKALAFDHLIMRLSAEPKDVKSQCYDDPAYLQRHIRVRVKASFAIDECEVEAWKQITFDITNNDPYMEKIVIRDTLQSMMSENAYIRFLLQQFVGKERGDLIFNSLPRKETQPPLNASYNPFTPYVPINRQY
jgi:hypothetical protein